MNREPRRSTRESARTLRTAPAGANRSGVETLESRRLLSAGPAIGRLPAAHRNPGPPDIEIIGFGQVGGRSTLLVEASVPAGKKFHHAGGGDHGATDDANSAGSGDFATDFTTRLPTGSGGLDALERILNVRPGDAIQVSTGATPLLLRLATGGAKGPGSSVTVEQLYGLLPPGTDVLVATSVQPGHGQGRPSYEKYPDSQGPAPRTVPPGMSRGRTPLALTPIRVESAGWTRSTPLPDPTALSASHSAASPGGTAGSERASSGHASIGLTAYAPAAMFSGTAVKLAAELAQATNDVTQTLSAVGAGQVATAEVVYNFVHFNPAALLNDAIAQFSGDSAALGSGPASGGVSSAQAWAVTASVVGLDVLLIGYWFKTRREDRAARRGVWGTAVEPCTERLL